MVLDRSDKDNDKWRPLAFFIEKDAHQRGYEVLRQSLVEAQKRCQSYNENMLRVAHANDELAGTLNTVLITRITIYCFLFGCTSNTNYYKT